MWEVRWSSWWNSKRFCTQNFQMQCDYISWCHYFIWFKRPVAKTLAASLSIPGNKYKYPLAFISQIVNSWFVLSAFAPASTKTYLDVKIFLHFNRIQSPGRDVSLVDTWHRFAGELNDVGSFDAYTLNFANWVAESETFISCLYGS